jgi:flagella basal body P-ring formation protein FlgA
MKAHALMLLVALTGLFSFSCFGAELEPEYQDLDQLRTQALEFLKRLPGQSSTTRITIGFIDSHIKLAPCSTIEFFLPNNSNQRGNIRLGVRCISPQAWSLFVSASVLEPKTYLISRTALDKDHVIDKQDVIATEVFQAHTAPGALSDAQQILGRSLTHPILAGATLRNTDLHPEPSLARGQTVKIVSVGTGFKITRTGQLITDTHSGQNAQVRTASKQVITGVARSGGIIEITLHKH